MHAGQSLILRVVEAPSTLGKAEILSASRTELLRRRLYSGKLRWAAFTAQRLTPDGAWGWGARQIKLTGGNDPSRAKAPKSMGQAGQIHNQGSSEAAAIVIRTPEGGHSCDLRSTDFYACFWVIFSVILLRHLHTLLYYLPYVTQAICKAISLVPLPCGTIREKSF